MTDSDLYFRTLVAALGLMVSTACIINTDDDDDGLVNDGTTTGGTPSTNDGQPADSTGDDGNDDATGDSGGSTEQCPGAENLVLDPGFEAGSPSAAWTEASDVFGSPICDTSCTDEEGAEPYAGQWWAWFGGVEDEPENASLEQSIVIDPDMAYLTFRFQIRSGAATGDDVFTVELGGDTVFMVTDLDMPDYEGAYQEVSIDVSPWADGGEYALRFSSQHAGTGLTSFFLDEVSLVSCSEDVGTSTGMATMGQDDTGTGSDGGTTGDTGTGSGSSGGSSGGTGGSGTTGGSSTG